MRRKQTPNKSAPGRKPKAAAKGQSQADDDEPPNPPPRLAFRKFELEDESHGRRRMRNFGRHFESTHFVKNSYGEMSSVYQDALGNSRVKRLLCKNLAGEVVHEEPWQRLDQEDAARELLAIAKNATLYLSLLLERQPDLCKRIAARKSDWPVWLDLTEKDWQRELSETVSKLELGKEIDGYILSARTADENVIRCWATAIFETLYQSRFDFKSAVEEPRDYITTDGCPEWVGKTLDLPPFSKADSRLWARLGEEMLLQQQPDFLDSPDLVTKKRSWTHRAQKKSRSGKVTVRAIHREAFEDFAKELKKLAPETPGNYQNW